MWRYGCPRSLDWNSDVDSWTENEESSVGTSSDEKYVEHNVESLAHEVIGQKWTGDMGSFTRIGSLRG